MRVAVPIKIQNPNMERQLLPALNLRMRLIVLGVLLLPLLVE